VVEMGIDWLSVTIWLIGVAVFVVWIIFPLREFVKLVRERIKR
jgi:hypothetical protein